MLQTPMRLCLLLVTLFAAAANAQTTQTLLATPSTVAWGYYSTQSTPQAHSLKPATPARATAKSTSRHSKPSSPAPSKFVVHKGEATRERLLWPRAETPTAYIRWASTKT